MRMIKRKVAYADGDAASIVMRVAVRQQMLPSYFGDK